MRIFFGSKAIGRLSFCLAISSVLLLASCSRLFSPDILHISGPTMGTQYHISWVDTGDVSEEALQALVDSRLREINHSMSTYDKSSELSLLNQRKDVDPEAWIDVSADLMAVLRDADEVSRYSVGRLDVTVGPLVNRWGFGPDDERGVPSTEEIAKLLEQVGMKSLILSRDKNQIRMLRPLYIDLSAVAKGWGVDEIGRLLASHGVNNYLVEIGGELRTRGSKPEGAWSIAVERPVSTVADRQAELILSLGDNAVATSGDYRNYYEEGGVRYSHTIDPLTGYPIRHALASVTVVHDSCSLADAWATALNVAGPEAAIALAEANDLAVFMIIREGDGFTEMASSRFQQKFQSTPINGANH
ncbi:FAD:protein FMN transferase [Thalassolituus oleivorans]|uniref:FAD:protein FMN transferase n=1 Tax=Thalassolituus oleivorans MIL-1 TaxID=1298593 RepID=M5DQM2_9GAMM|nr:FAD:protein FMN transferase [Thalassolituus oleivorans]CCU72230.1 thiamin biosynthesis lipoprotein ApbE [Thalassolituus oleivorans MIL-1]